MTRRTIACYGVREYELLMPLEEANAMRQLRETAEQIVAKEVLSSTPQEATSTEI